MKRFDFHVRFKVTVEGAGCPAVDEKTFVSVVKSFVRRAALGDDMDVSHVADPAEDKKVLEKLAERHQAKMGAATEGTGAFSAMNVGKCETVTREDGANAHAFVVESSSPARDLKPTRRRSPTKSSPIFPRNTSRRSSRREVPPRARLPRRRFPWTRWSSTENLGGEDRGEEVDGRVEEIHPGGREGQGVSEKPIGAWTVFRIFNVYLYFAEPSLTISRGASLFHQRVGRQLTFSARKNVTKLRRCVWYSGSRGRHRQIQPLARLDSRARCLRTLRNGVRRNARRSAPRRDPRV